MNKKLALLSILSALAISANACETGEYNDLNCDESYQTECLSPTHFMACQNGKLIVDTCGSNAYCHVDESGVGACIAFNPETEPECSASKPCADATKECSAEGKCVDKQTEPECTAENAAEKCSADKPVCSAEGKCVADEPECAYDIFCTDGKVCEEGKCVDPECDVDSPCETGKMCYNGACITEPAALNPTPMENVEVTPAELAGGETAPTFPSECATIDLSNIAEVATMGNGFDYVKEGNKVTINITAADVCIELMGEHEGSVTIKDASNHGASIKLNNVNIKEFKKGSGLAIKNGDITSGAHYLLSLAGENVITGGVTSKSKKVLSCNGNLDIIGDGSLTVNAKYKTGVGVDDILKIYSGTLNINLSRDENVEWDLDDADPENPVEKMEKGFGIKAGNGFEMVGGALNIFAHDTKEFKGVEPRGVKVDGMDAVDPEDGSIADYGKGKGKVIIKAGDIVIQSDAKALSAGWDIEEDATTEATEDDPTPDLEISGGRIQIRTFGDVRDEPVNPDDDPKLSPEGIEGKRNVTISGGEISIYTSDDAINAGNDISITGGKIIAWSTQNDGIDANHEIHIEGGQITAMGTHGRECGLDADYNEDVYYIGGTVMSLSGNNNAPMGAGNLSFAEVVLGNESLAGKTIVFAEKDSTDVIAAMQVPANYNSGNNLVVLNSNIQDGETYRVLVAPTITLETGATWFDSILNIMLDGAATFDGGTEYLVKAGLVPVEPPHGAKPADNPVQGADE